MPRGFPIAHSTSYSALRVALPPKGCIVDLESQFDSGDDIFDVSLTSNCMGAAVLIYQLVERLDVRFVEAVTARLGAALITPFGIGAGLVYVDTPDLGKAVLRYGSREIRLTLLLTASLDRREAIESALIQASDPVTKLRLTDRAANASNPE